MIKKLLIIFLLLPLFVFSEFNKDIIKDTGKSFILPGYGLWELDRKLNSLPYIVFETVFVPAFVYLSYSSVKTGEDALNFASYSISTNVSNYPDKLLTKMEFYNSYKDYNTKIISQARAYYPDDYEKQMEYINENIVSDSLGWEFPSDSIRMIYSDMRKRQREFKQFSYYTLFFVAMNHIAGAVNTFFVSKDLRNIHLKTEGQLDRINLKIGVNF